MLQEYWASTIIFIRIFCQCSFLSEEGTLAPLGINPFKNCSITDEHDSHTLKKMFNSSN